MPIFLLKLLWFLNTHLCYFTCDKSVLMEIQVFQEKNPDTQIAQAVGSSYKTWDGEKK